MASTSPNGAKVKKKPKTGKPKVRGGCVGSSGQG
jgi:hypothetical protein